jgi:hypothetical protein
MNWNDTNGDCACETILMLNAEVGRGGMATPL